MKANTDLEQSKKLAEILPLESADMHWQYIEEDNGQLQWFCFPKDFSINQHTTVSAWSLSALLNVLPVTCDDGRHCLSLINSNPNGNVDWLCCYEDCNGNLMMECYGINQVDACYEMILKMKELKLL